MIEHYLYFTTGYFLATALYLFIIERIERREK